MIYCYWIYFFNYNGTKLYYIVRTCKKKTIMIMVKISTTGRILVRVDGKLIDTSCHNQSQCPQ